MPRLSHSSRQETRGQRVRRRLVLRKRTNHVLLAPPAADFVLIPHRETPAGAEAQKSCAGEWALAQRAVAS